MLNNIVLLVAIIPWQATAALLSCRDKALCNDITNCTRHDAMLRAGYLCHGFPYFNGWGTSKPSPKSLSSVASTTIPWLDETQHWSRLNTSTTEWVAWTAASDANKYSYTHNCSCTEPACTGWVCQVMELRTCPSGQPCDASVVFNGTSVTQNCCTKVCTKYNCQTIRSNRVREWTARCACDSTTSSCTCVNTAAPPSRPGVDLAPVGTQESNCTAGSGLPGHGQCGAWRAMTDDPVGDYFALSQCDCSAPSVEGGPCPQWTCASKRLSYVHIDMGWALGSGLLLPLLMWIGSGVLPMLWMLLLFAVYICSCGTLRAPDSWVSNFSFPLFFAVAALLCVLGGWALCVYIGGLFPLLISMASYAALGALVGTVWVVVISPRRQRRRREFDKWLSGLGSGGKRASPRDLGSVEVVPIGDKTEVAVE